MNRLSISLLAAGFLGMGCVASDTCDAHTVWVGWPTFVRATQTGYATTSSCADIARIDVFVDDAQQPISASCTDDSVPVTLLTGNHTFTVEAVGSDGFPFLRDQTSAGISSSCADQVVSAQPGEGLVTLHYDFGGAGCISGGSYIWFNVHDQIAQLDIAGVNQNSSTPRFYPCNASSVQPPFPLPAGTYTLDWIEEVVPSGSGYSVAAGYCTQTPFAVSSGIDEPVSSVTLADGVSCP